MTVYYAPSTRDYAAVTRALEQLFRKYPRVPFQIGRCAEVDADKLEYRVSYQDASAIHGIWSGSPGKCATLEVEITAWARANHPDLCQNQKHGGGPQSGEQVHLVYVVFW